MRIQSFVDAGPPGYQGATRDTHSMKAIVHERYGAPADVLDLREVDAPTPADDQVLIRVAASSVNPYDWHVMRGIPYAMRLVSGFLRPRKQILGADVSGVVEAVGAKVTRLAPSDAVFADAGAGAFAEYVAVPEKRVSRAPANIPLEHAAAVPLAGITALQGLRDKAQTRDGQRVLVIGASGGVGVFAVQIARAFGAEVVGVCSSANADLVESLGATEVIDYTREDVTRAGVEYDAVFQLGGTDTASELEGAVTPTGALVMASGDSPGRVFGPVGRTIVARVRSPFVGHRISTLLASPNADDLDALRAMIEAGQVTPVVSATYSLADLPEAMRQIETGHTRGKVIVTI